MDTQRYGAEILTPKMQATFPEVKWNAKECKEKEKKEMKRGKMLGTTLKENLTKPKIGKMSRKCIGYGARQLPKLCGQSPTRKGLSNLSTRKKGHTLQHFATQIVPLFSNGFKSVLKLLV